ncbi:hypothetical protein CDL12_17272 [Handroanthus impetiginosus]|uniref:Uncharacterized protein n=1 Tax=Handroanthus impetiginosus TaxID=429701 RepID=A0A2G9GY51_9LAMI|nr:hypothetical protein CDL12_17272 [Handroanthus impetiginosus]
MEPTDHVCSLSQLQRHTTLGYIVGRRNFNSFLEKDNVLILHFLGNIVKLGCRTLQSYMEIHS